jgi:hypothetical protein
MNRTRTVLTAYAGILASLLAAALLVAAPWHAAMLAGALLLACVPAGAAVMCWIDSGEGAAQAGLTLAISISVLAILSAIMVWTSTWQPHALLALAAVSLASCSVRLRHEVPR